MVNSYLEVRKIGEQREKIQNLERKFLAKASKKIAGTILNQLKGYVNLNGEDKWSRTRLQYYQAFVDEEITEKELIKEIYNHN